MMFKGRYEKITDGGIVVARVPLEGDIIMLGVFWRPEAANFFAKALS